MAPSQLTLGCDPELVCRLNGKFTSASEYFRPSSSMGLDGNDSIAEIRPGLSESPIKKKKKIKTVLEYGNEKHPELEFFSGHYVDGYPIGGHIHISAKPTDELIDSLDTVLYSFSDCIDDKDQRHKRETSGYGNRKSHSSKYYGFEYRTPGSWLLSPSTALVTLTLAKLTTIGVLEDHIDFVNIKSDQDPCHFLKNYKDYLETIPPDCEEGLTELGFLLNMNIDWNQNILPNWGLEVAA